MKLNSQEWLIVHLPSAEHCLVSRPVHRRRLMTGKIDQCHYDTGYLTGQATGDPLRVDSKTEAARYIATYLVGVRHDGESGQPNAVMFTAKLDTVPR